MHRQYSVLRPPQFIDCMGGPLSDVQLMVLTQLVGGKRILCLGCGPQAQEVFGLLHLGAQQVTGIDKSFADDAGDAPNTKHWIIDGSAVLLDENVTELTRRLLGLSNFDMVFLKWPDNNPGLPRALRAFQDMPVLYIGRNDGITACGSPALWHILGRRSIRCVVEGDHSDMTLYGTHQVFPASFRTSEEIYSGAANPQHFQPGEERPI